MYLTWVTDQSASKRLFFARDPLGRRSLLIHKPTPQQPYFLLASVSAGSDPGYTMKELSTEHIYSLDLQRLGDLQDVCNHLGLVFISRWFTHGDQIGIDFDSCLYLMERKSNNVPSTSISYVSRPKSSKLKLILKYRPRLNRTESTSHSLFRTSPKSIALTKSLNSFLAPWTILYRT